MSELSGVSRWSQGPTLDYRVAGNIWATIWILARHRYQPMVRRSRYIAILTPTLALISMIPFIGVHPISGLSDIGYIGYTRYRVYTDIGIISQYTDIGVHPISGIPDLGAYPILAHYYRVYPISGMLQYRYDILIYQYQREPDIVSSLDLILCHWMFWCRENWTWYRRRCSKMFPARGPGLAFMLLAAGACLK